MRLEHFDDIEFESGGSPLELIQTKCRTTSNRSLTDYSPDLWNTLQIWSELILGNVLVPEKMVFTLVTTSPAPIESAASMLRPSVQEGRNVTAAFERLRQIACDPNSKGNTDAKAIFMRLPINQQLLLLESIQIIDGAPSIIDIEKELEKELVLGVDKQYVSELRRNLEGWWANTIIQHLSRPTAEPITFEEVQKKVVALEQQFRDDNLPITIDNKTIIPEEVLALDNRTFIRQLKLIEVSSLRIIRAAKQFYKASEQRAIWVKEDPRRAEELEAYDQKLIEEWAVRHDEMADTLGASANADVKVALGKEFYSWFEKADIPLRPRISQPFITRGSYQQLSDRRQVGWHIDYDQLL